MKIKYQIVIRNSVKSFLTKDGDFFGSNESDAKLFSSSKVCMKTARRLFKLHQKKYPNRFHISIELVAIYGN